MSKQLNIYHSIRQSILWIGLVVAFFSNSYAGNNDDSKPKDNQPNEAKNVSSASQAEALRMQKAMNKALSGLNLDFAYVKPEVIMQPLVADETNEARERAMTTFEKVKYMSELSVLNTVLPIGIKETIGNTSVEVAIASLNIYPNYAEVTIYCRMHFKDKNAPNGERDIFFGAQNVKIGSGGLIDGAELALLGDVTLPFGDHSFTFKGGYDEKTGASKSLTYIKVGCKGFEYVSINGVMKFSRNQVLPYDAANRVAKSTGNVEVAIQTIASSLDDIFVTVNVPTFCLKGNEKWGYAVSQATFDFSDIRAVSGGVYPKVGGQDYWQAVGEEKIETWKGIHVRKFEVLFPKEFVKKGSKQISAAANNLILDKNGISALAEVKIEDATKPSTLDDGRAGKWKMSINTFYLDVVLNRFNGGGLGGDIVLPVQNAKVNPSGDLNTNGPTEAPAPDKFQYAAIIYKGGDIEFSLSTASTIDFKLFGFAKAKIAPGSVVRMSVEGGKIVPYAKLTGSLSISTKISNASDNTAAADNKLDGIVFRDLVLQDKVPKVSVAYFGYEKTSSSANFPISIDQISVALYPQNTIPTGQVVCGNLTATPNRSYAVISIGSSVSLDTTFGGSASFNIVGHFDEDEGEEESYVQFDCMKLTDMCIKTNFSVFTLQAGFKMYNDGPNGPKGFEGQMVLGIKKPEMTICAAGRFTKDASGKSYWYIDGGVDGLNINMGAAKLTSIQGGVFRRMIQKQDGTTKNSGGFVCAACSIPNGTGSNGAIGIHYEPEDRISLGFRAAVGIADATGKTFNGVAGIEIILNEHWGLRSVGIYGNGEFAPANPKNLPKVGGGLADALNKVVKEADLIVTNSDIGKKITDSDLIAKATKTFSDNKPKAKPNRISFDFGFKLDLDKDNGSTIFHGTANVYADIANGTLRGIGPNGKAGWMVMHFEKDNWYIHIGSPTDKIGLALKAGPIVAKVGAYFMVGHQIPALPPLPPQLVSMLSGEQKGQLNNGPNRVNPSDPALTSGEGIAFGADLSISTGDIQALIFYASFDAGVGFDLMMKKQGICNVANGGNGWYAYGRMYAYMQGELGIIVKVFGIKKKFHLIKGGAGVILEGGFPNPAWFQGSVAGRYSVLGGAVRGNFNMDVKIGNNQCRL
ncbi:hypothetical protein [Emticicia sp. 17c]|uniref:hypothetical protein n=1 Tax=Emticicia sp. 17c TaxID=3127704 RepID=UPI00301C47DF